LHTILEGRSIIRLIPVLVVIALVCLAGCSTQHAAIPETTLPAANLTASPVHVVSNVRYVDSIGQNFLLRGAHPLIEQTGVPPEFDYAALRTAIEKAARDAGCEVPANFTLVDVSLLWVENPQDNNRERALLIAEDAFFTAHPGFGQVHMWPMHGTSLDPADPSIAVHREYLAQHLDEWLQDSLVSRVDTVRKWLEDPAAAGMHASVVIYVHCYGGCDRTGELIGAYSLRYLNMTWEEVRDQNGARCRPDRDYDEANCHALQWYGIWLNLTYGRPLNWEADPPCYRRPAQPVTQPPSATPTPTTTLSTTPAGDETSCTNATQCVPAQCCHPTSCINYLYKKPCTELCTMVCTGPLDCGAGHCGCVSGNCQVIPATPGYTPAAS
jgi:hypothetical protein